MPHSPVSGQEMCLRLAHYQKKCFYLSYSVNKLQAISPSSQQHVGEPDLESENIDMLSDGGELFLCVSVASSARMFWVPYGVWAW